MNNEQNAEKSKRSILLPEVRFNKTMKIAQERNFGNDSYLNHLSMVIDTKQMVQVKARILEPPAIVYRNNRVVSVTIGKWLMKGNLLQQTTRVHKLGDDFSPRWKSRTRSHGYAEVGRILSHVTWGQRMDLSRRFDAPPLLDDTTLRNSIESEFRNENHFSRANSSMHSGFTRQWRGIWSVHSRWRLSRFVPNDQTLCLARIRHHHSLYVSSSSSRSKLDFSPLQVAIWVRFVNRIIRENWFVLRLLVHRWNVGFWV